MTEHISEERLALYAGRDLPADEAANVEAHLRGCGECQAQAGEYRKTQEFLAAAVLDPEPDELREVRAGIARRLRDHRRRATALWVWPAAAAAVLALFFVASILRLDTHTSDSMRPMVTHVKTPETLWMTPVFPAPHLEIAALRKKRPDRRPGIRTVALLRRPDEPALIKMTTSDPNVVILWEASERVQ